MRALRGAQEKANAVVLATRKGGDHMPFGLVSERYGGRILTETPPELRGARGHLICAFLSSWLVVLGWFQQRSLVGRLTVLTVCHLGEFFQSRRSRRRNCVFTLGLCAAGEIEKVRAGYVKTAGYTKDQLDKKAQRKA